MSQSMKRAVDNRASSLLTADENALIFKLMGPRCQSLVTSVVQLVLKEPPNHDKWIVRLCGVACLVKDNPRRSYYIKVFDLDKQILAWEQELCTQLKLKTSPFARFFSFEADNSQAGLNFADEEEASIFYSVVEDKMSLINPRRTTIRKRVDPPHENSVITPTNDGVTALQPTSTDEVMPQPNHANGGAKSLFIKGNKGNKKEKGKLSKSDIPQPTQFRHVSHISWDPEKGFDCENIENDLKPFFARAGANDRQLNDKETRKFIYDFIERNGGLEAGKLEANRASTLFDGPPVPKRQPRPRAVYLV